jgi:predicted metal-dependent HD superfamily phosphohydrolase
MVESSLLKKSKAFAESILKKLPDGCTYHNLRHTKEVVVAAKEIAEQEGLTEIELENVITAAWFHDLGYECDLSNHEAEGVRLLKEQLTSWGISDSRINEIATIILSTKMPQTPTNKLSEVMCDADLYHVSTDSFDERSKALRAELKSVCNQNISESDWMAKTYDFMKNHSYFTNYGKEVLEPKKKKNLKKLKKKIKKNKNSPGSFEVEIEKLKEKLEKSKIQKPDRGIETMFRITSKNHLQLSAMADNKANIMISINSIILSVLVSILFRKFEDYPQLILPALMLVIVCLTTIVFAVLATRPNISSGTFTPDEIKEKKTNLLFFGNFHSMKLDDYMWGMREMMKDADYLYGSMIKDIYFLGIVLGKKYKMLRKSYNIFMFGFIISILSFIVAMMLYPASH